jgi:hypothetical protein
MAKGEDDAQGTSGLSRLPQRTWHSPVGDRMRSSRSVIGWLPLWLLTGCVASHTQERPAVDRLLSRGDIQVAEVHLRDFGFDPGPIDGTYTAETAAAVRGYQARYGLPVMGLLDYATRLQLLPGLQYDKADR